MTGYGMQPHQPGESVDDTDTSGALQDASNAPVGASGDDDLDAEIRRVLPLRILAALNAGTVRASAIMAAVNYLKSVGPSDRKLGKVDSVPTASTPMRKDLPFPVSKQLDSAERLSTQPYNGPGSYTA